MYIQRPNGVGQCLQRRGLCEQDVRTICVGSFSVWATMGKWEQKPCNAQIPHTRTGNMDPQDPKGTWCPAEKSHKGNILEMSKSK